MWTSFRVGDYFALFSILLFFLTVNLGSSRSRCQGQDPRQQVYVGVIPRNADGGLGKGDKEFKKDKKWCVIKQVATGKLKFNPIEGNSEG